MIIIGAGMSGMLAGHFFRSRNPIIYDKQASLPNNHTALLRFRSDAVSQLTGIPFKEVRVQKMINYLEAHITEPDLFLNNLYSQKVTGMVRSRSALSLKNGIRYIAPPNFIEQLSNGLNFKFDSFAHPLIAKQVVDSSEPMISTMPVSELAKSLGYELKADLLTRPIWTVKFNIHNLNVDVYQTVYYPNPKLPIYRISITGDQVIAEFCRDPAEWNSEIWDNLKHFLEIDFGIMPSDYSILNLGESYQHYGKLIPENTDVVKDFLGWATRKHNIYSLGRWGTHRQLLMDDVVADLKVINNMINSNQYRR